jgi:thioredoxin-related protein
MPNRREFGAGALGAALVLAAAAPARRPSAAEPGRIEPILSDDGLYQQPWFLSSFLILEDDLAEAAAAGKRLVVFWEQKGCPYCKETHLVNLADPEINTYVRENFSVLQLNLWGAREVTDFDGEALEERALARKWGITFTPTIMFFEESVEKIAGRSGREAEVVRMPGYFKPFHFISMFEFVKEKAYETEHFQKYIQAKAERLREQGKQVKIW